MAFTTTHPVRNITDHRLSNLERFDALEYPVDLAIALFVLLVVLIAAAWISMSLGGSAGDYLHGLPGTSPPLAYLHHIFTA